MATAMTLDVAGFPVAPPGAASLKHKRWRKGARQNNQRYNNNIHKVVKSQGQGLQKRRRFNRRSVPRSVPRAPYNDSSFLMQVRKAGGLESQIVALTPSSFMSTPKDSSYKLDTCDDFVDHEDYGYGSMTGLIRLRSDDSDCSTVENNSSDDDNLRVELSSVLSAEELEQRLDRGVSRFEMTYPSPQDLNELQVARQESHIKCLEDENLVLKDRLFLMQQKLNELKQRLQGDQIIDRLVRRSWRLYITSSRRVGTFSRMFNITRLYWYLHLKFASGMNAACLYSSAVMSFESLVSANRHASWSAECAVWWNSMNASCRRQIFSSTLSSSHQATSEFLSLMYSLHLDGPKPLTKLLASTLE